MERRCLQTITAALLCVAALAACVTVAEARPKHHKIKQAQKAILDCAIDGDLDKHYSTKVLLKALKILPADIDQYTDCRRVIEWRLLRINRRPARVIADCASDGYLDRHYGRGVLKRALLILPSDIDEYTDCRRVIRRALCRHRRARNRALRRHRFQNRRARR